MKLLVVVASVIVVAVAQREDFARLSERVRRLEREYESKEKDVWGSIKGNSERIKDLQKRMSHLNSYANKINNEFQKARKEVGVVLEKQGRSLGEMGGGFKKIGMVMEAKGKEFGGYLKAQGGYIKDLYKKVADLQKKLDGKADKVVRQKIFNHLKKKWTSYGKPTNKTVYVKKAVKKIYKHKPYKNNYYQKYNRTAWKAYNKDYKNLYHLYRGLTQSQRQQYLKQAKAWHKQYAHLLRHNTIEYSKVMLEKQKQFYKNLKAPATTTMMPIMEPSPSPAPEPEPEIVTEPEPEPEEPVIDEPIEEPVGEPEVMVDPVPHPVHISEEEPVDTIDREEMEPMMMID